MKRHEYRIKLMSVIYQHLLLKKDFLELIQDNLEDVPVDEYFKQIVNYYRKNFSTLVEEIKPLLRKWDFSRLNYVGQAILLLSVIEIKLAKEDKAVVINEAVELSKEYCDDEDYKYINAVLDRYES